MKIGKDVLGGKRFSPRSPISKNEAEKLKPVMKTISIGKLAKILKDGLIITAKINGEFTVFHYIKDLGIYSINRYGTIRTDVYPHIKELKSLLDKTGIREAILLGETYSMSNGKIDPLPTFIHKVRSEDSALLEDLRIGLFDIVTVNGKRIRRPTEFKLNELENWTENGNKVHVVPYAKVRDWEDAKAFWSHWVEHGPYEGIVSVDKNGVIYKTKPEKSVDAVLIGINKRKRLKEGIVSSVSVALMRPDGKFVKLSDVTVTDTKLGVALYKFFQTRKIWEDKDTIYIPPEIIFEIGFIDKLTSERPVYNKNLRRVGKMDFFSLVSPKILRLRDDKTVNKNDLRLEQLAF